MNRTKVLNIIKNKFFCCFGTDEDVIVIATNKSAFILKLDSYSKRIYMFKYLDQENYNKFINKSKIIPQGWRLENNSDNSDYALVYERPIENFSDNEIGKIIIDQISVINNINFKQ